MPAAGLAHEGGPVPHQCHISPPLLPGRLAAAPNQTQRVFWRSRLVRLAVAQLVVAKAPVKLLYILIKRFIYEGRFYGLSRRQQVYEIKLNKDFLV